MAHEWICVSGTLIHLHGDREVINVILQGVEVGDRAEDIIEAANSREKASAEMYP